MVRAPRPPRGRPDRSARGVSRPPVDRTGGSTRGRPRRERPGAQHVALGQGHRPGRPHAVAARPDGLPAAALEVATHLVERARVALLVEHPVMQTAVGQRPSTSAIVAVLVCCSSCIHTSRPRTSRRGSSRRVLVIEAPGSASRAASSACCVQCTVRPSTRLGRRPTAWRTPSRRGRPPCGRTNATASRGSTGTTRGSPTGAPRLARRRRRRRARAAAACPRPTRSSAARRRSPRAAACRSSRTGPHDALPLQRRRCRGSSTGRLGCAASRRVGRGS